jgi:hypothetical protein
MKKLFLAFVMLMLSASSTFAQFEQGKKYVGASVSGLNASFNNDEDWKIDFSTKLGIMVEDNWMITGQLECNYRKQGFSTIGFGGGVRYYIVQNGLYLGAGGNLKHSWYEGEKTTDVLPTVQVGYAFFLNRILTIEPELYYNQSLKSHSDYSGIGLRIGIGIYLD